MGEADEAWKARYCRVCPHCSRTVEKIDGCNLIRCGRDTDTGQNQQPGCGNRFQFDEAARYVANEGAKKVHPGARRLFTTTKKVLPIGVHTYANGELKHCSICNNVCNSSGPVAECVHCPPDSCVVCICCQDRLRSGTAGHQADHVFKLVQSRRVCTALGHALRLCNCARVSEAGR